jgi:hypothetical protein
MAASMALSPDTPADVVTKEIADALDMVLIMTVVPGKAKTLSHPPWFLEADVLLSFAPSQQARVGRSSCPSACRRCVSVPRSSHEVSVAHVSTSSEPRSPSCASSTRPSTSRSTAASARRPSRSAPTPAQTSSSPARPSLAPRARARSSRACGLQSTVPSRSARRSRDRDLRSHED